MATNLPPDTIARVLRIAAPTVDITGWTVVADAYPARTPSTAALDRVATGTDGSTVRIFAKTLRSLRHWPPIAYLPEAIREAAIARFPWRVEADVYASPLLSILPSGLRGPRVHLVEDLGDDRARVWMEDVPEASMPWDTARYATAARLLGRLAGRSLRDGLPEGSPALFPGPRFVFTARTAVMDVPAVRNEESWSDPVAVSILASDPTLRDDLLRLADEAPAILDELDRLPQALAHGDGCPQNLLVDPDRVGGFVAIDWGFAGLAPVGYDLGQLLVGRAESGALGAADLPAIHDAILDAYLAGLDDEGGALSREEVARGFEGGMLLRSAFTALPLDRLRGPLDDAAARLMVHRARYARYLLDLGVPLGWGR